MNCPFCELEPSRVLHEGPLVRALWDGFPVSAGHALIVPRRHVASWFDATAEEHAAMLEAVPIVRALIERTHRPDGYNLGVNVGEAAGQTVFHLHLHVIPRYSGDVPDPRGGVRGVIPGKQRYAAMRPDDTSSPFASLPAFVPGEEVPFVETLRRALLACERADLLAAFVQPSGLTLLKPDLEDACARGVRVRVLTGDYLGITHADALRTLLQLAHDHPSFEARMYCDPAKIAFHPKSYLFQAGGHGVAYVGSSNLSQSALGAGVEWNLRLVAAGERATFDALAARFQRLWNDPRALPLSAARIADYQQRAPVPVAPQPEPRTAPPEPNDVQLEALAALRRTREEGRRRGLVVLATGLGKTFLSAFDFRALGGKRALFVAHRDEILGQAQAAWQRVLPEKTTGLLVGGRYETDVDVLFASVQTLSRERHLARFSPDHFDYVVIDEFHHASASTYRKILGHFQARFLLGLTATPDRLDGVSLLELCDDNLVLQRGLLHGIGRQLLVPFRYFGLKDRVDFAPIPWRSGRFDANALTSAVETRERAEDALRAYRERTSKGSRRALAFCVSTTHADFMARFFTENGHPAAAVHSGATTAPRAASLRRLREGTLEILCAVDVFNEGLDVPEIDVVLMLRPTLSPVVFLQQLGRGLRTVRDGSKTHLTVIDFIGNHASFLQKPQALLYLMGEELPAVTALATLREGKLGLPEGCSIAIELEAIDMLERLARVSREDALLYEYVTFRSAHGRRPTAAELASRVGFKPIVTNYGDWFEFVRQQGDLGEDELRVHARHRAWWSDLLRTKMNRSYKAVALAVLIEADRLFEGMPVRDHAERAYASMERHPLFRRELEGDVARWPFSNAAVATWRELPLKVWAGRDSTSRPWFRLDGDDFVPTYEVATLDRSTFEAMTEELVELRLRMRLDALRTEATADSSESPAVLVVSHTAGKPILRFDRAIRPDLPEGDATVEVDGASYVFRFAKIAVNWVGERAGGPNVLPALMRRWFGISAGQPGTHHRVELVRLAERWVLRPPTGVDAPEEGAEVIPFPRLPYFADLQVACGAFALTERLTEATRMVAFRVERPTDPTRHFVVRASGDSMNGGDAPIRDGDHVLCEWWSGGDEREVVGRPFLLVGHDSAETSFAAIKVPARRDGRWVLRSWNPAAPDLELPPGGRVEPVARVLGVVEEARGFTRGETYSRDAIARAFGHPNNPSWKVGHRDVTVHEQAHTVLMVTLRKDPSLKLEHRYADRFLSPDELQWESQATTAVDSVKGRHILHHASEGRVVHLFARLTAQDAFLYCGTVTYQSHEGEKPMKVRWRLAHPLPASVWHKWA